jgi:hypothetical protein
MRYLLLNKAAIASTEPVSVEMKRTDPTKKRKSALLVVCICDLGGRVAQL